MIKRSQKKKQGNGWEEEYGEKKEKEKAREGREGEEEGFSYFHAVLIICSDQGAFMV